MIKGDLCISTSTEDLFGSAIITFPFGSFIVVIDPRGPRTSSLEVQARPDTNQRPEMDVRSDIVCEFFDKKDNSCSIEKINKKGNENRNVILSLKVF